MAKPKKKPSSSKKSKAKQSKATQFNSSQHKPTQRKPKVSSNATLSSLKRKTKFIDKRLSEFGSTFGYYSKEYQDLESTVLTNLGALSPRAFKSKKPLQITEVVVSYATQAGVTSSASVDVIHKAFRGKTVFKKLKEKYGADILRAYNANKSTNNKQREFTSSFVSRNKKFIDDYVSSRSFISMVESSISDMPNYYTALDNMDWGTSTRLRTKFGRMGHLHKENKEEADIIAKELKDEIENYFRARIEYSELIIKAERLTDEELEGGSEIDRTLMQEPTTLADLADFLKK